MAKKEFLICPNCGARNPVDHHHCKMCGRAIGLGARKGAVAEGKPSAAWYCLPILLGFIGGIIGYFVVKDKDPNMAKNLLLIGIFITIIGVLLSFVLVGRYWVVWEETYYYY